MSAGLPLSAALWNSLPPKARALILALGAEAAELRAKGQALQLQVQELQERLNLNSTNSSQPPSTDSPAVKRRVWVRGVSLPTDPASNRAFRVTSHAGATGGRFVGMEPAGTCTLIARMPPPNEPSQRQQGSG